MVDAKNHDNYKQPNTHDSKRKIQVATIKAKYQTQFK
jgi:hypothetical protein